MLHTSGVLQDLGVLITSVKLYIHRLNYMAIHHTIATITNHVSIEILKDLYGLIGHHQKERTKQTQTEGDKCFIMLMQSIII